MKNGPQPPAKRPADMRFWKDWNGWEVFYSWMVGALVSLVCYVGWLSSMSPLGKFLGSQIYPISLGYTRLLLKAIDWLGYQFGLSQFLPALAPYAAGFLFWGGLGIGIGLAAYTLWPVLFSKYPSIRGGDKTLAWVSSILIAPMVSFAASMMIGLPMFYSIGIAWGLTTLTGSYWCYRKRVDDLVPPPSPRPKLEARRAAEQNNPPVVHAYDRAQRLEQDRRQAAGAPADEQPARPQRGLGL